MNRNIDKIIEELHALKVIVRKATERAEQDARKPDGDADASV